MEKKVFLIFIFLYFNIYIKYNKYTHFTITILFFACGPFDRSKNMHFFENLFTKSCISQKYAIFRKFIFKKLKSKIKIKNQ